MKIFRNPKQLVALKKPIFLTIGTFDGLHRGHGKLLQKLRARAKKGKGISCVLTFKEHPFQVLHPKRNPGFLTSTLHKLALLERTGIDACLLLDFTKEFSKQTPDAFVKNFLVKRLKVKEVHLGYKSHFGFHRAGNTETMSSLAKKYGFYFSETKPFKDLGVPLSSTLIRDLIQKGDLREASRFLGRPYSVLGQTVRGQKIGRKLGYPTANLDLRSEYVPPRGVYAVTVDILKLNKWILRQGQFLDSKPEVSHLRGVMNIGVRPTTNPIKPVVVPEVHLLDYHKNLYGRILEVTFHSRIRSERKFSSLAALKEQIKLDEKEAIKVLKRVK